MKMTVTAWIETDNRVVNLVMLQVSLPRRK